MNRSKRKASSQYILIFHGPSSREFILSPSVSLSNTIQWWIHAGFVDVGGGALDPPLVYCLGWIGTVGKLALPIPPPPKFEASLRPCLPQFKSSTVWFDCFSVSHSE